MEGKSQTTVLSSSAFLFESILKIRGACVHSFNKCLSPSSSVLATILSGVTQKDKDENFGDFKGLKGLECMLGMC